MGKYPSCPERNLRVHTKPHNPDSRSRLSGVFPAQTGPSSEATKTF